MSSPHPAGHPEPETSHETSPEMSPGTETRPRSGFHAVNTGHLVMGLAFLGLSLVWLLFDRGTVEIPDHGWVLGLPWLVAGAVGLAASAISGMRRGR